MDCGSKRSGFKRGGSKRSGGTCVAAASREAGPLALPCHAIHGSTLARLEAAAQDGFAAFSRDKTYAFLLHTGSGMGGVSRYQSDA